MVKLSPPDVKRLSLFLRSQGAKTHWQILRNVRILLAMSSDTASYESVSASLMVGRRSISETLKLFQAGGVDAVLATVRKAGKHAIPDAKKEEVREMGRQLREGKPIRLVDIAAATGLSLGAVSAILKRRRSQTGSPLPFT